MKRQLFFILGLILCISVHAYDFEANGIYYNITSLQDLTVEVTSGDKGYEGVVKIPESVVFNDKKFNVTRIGEKAFLSSSITEIELPHSILTVGEYAFRYSQLNSITIPSSILKFEHGAFGGCYNLNNVVIEDSDVNLEMPYNEWQVQNSSYFNNCNITSVYYGRNVDYRVGEVYDGLFWNQDNLKNVVIGSKVTYLGDNLFRHCDGLETIDIPSNVKTISVSTFEDCSSLKDVVFHEGLNEIWSTAFKNCKSIDKLILPSTLTKIEKEAFVGCTGITKVYSQLKEPFEIEESTFAGIVYLNSILYVPTGTKSLYKEKTGWKDFSSIVETDDFNNIIGTFRASINVSKGGYVHCNGLDISNSTNIITIKEGEDLKIRIKPDEGYVISSVIINGEETKDNVDDGVLTLTNIKSDIAISIYFEEMPISLNIQHAENGSLKLFVKRGDSFKFGITPAEGWKINTLMFNDKDVTNEINSDNEYTTPVLSENSILSVTFESTQSSVNSVRAQNIKVFATNGQIILRGADMGEPIIVYDEGGSVVVQAVTNDYEERLSINQRGIYIVKVDGISYKIFVNK